MRPHVVRQLVPLRERLITVGTVEVLHFEVHSLQVLTSCSFVYEHLVAQSTRYFSDFQVKPFVVALKRLKIGQDLATLSTLNVSLWTCEHVLVNILFTELSFTMCACGKLW